VTASASSRARATTGTGVAVVQLAAAPAFTPHKVGKLACSMNTLARLRGRVKLNPVSALD